MTSIDQGGTPGQDPGNTDLSTMAERFAAAALGCARYPVAAISLDGQLKAVANRGIPVSSLDRMAISSLCRRVVEHGRAWIVDDLWNEPSLPAGVASVGSGLRALAAWPLVIDGQTVGCLAVFDVIPRLSEPDVFDALAAMSLAAAGSLASLRELDRLRADGAREHAMLDEVPDGLLRVAADGMVIQCNRAARTLLGIAGDEPAGWRLRIDSEEGVSIEPGGQAASGDGPAWLLGQAVRLPGRRRDGARKVFEVKVATLLAAGPDLLVVLRDVTQLDEARQLLELHALIVEKTESSVLILDPGLGIEWCNAGFERLSGFSLDELMHTSVERFFGDDQAGAAGFGRLALAGEPFHEDFNWRARGDARFTISLEAHPIFDGAGRLSRIVALGFDVTEQRQRASRKSDFVSMVSHELRAPLTVIRGTLDALSEGMLGEIDGYGREILELGQRNCKRLAGLIEDLLDVNQIESGVVRLSIGDVSMPMLMRDAAASMQAIAREAAVALRLGPVLEPGRVRADPKRVTQILVNLLGNAIKFSPEGKPVELSSRRVGDMLRVSVADQGQGIPNDFKPRLFELFSREPGVAASGKEGFGLGLCISKGLVERMGGTIGFESEQGIGSTFYFELPLAPADAGAAARPRRHWNLTA